MDHFLYLPIIGLLGLVVAALGQLEERLTASARPYAMGGIAVVMVLLTFGSHRYAKVFLNSESEWTYTIRQNPDAWAAHNDLGNALLDAKRLPEAKAQYEEALRLNPGYPEAHNNLGIVLYETGHPYEALDQFELALKYCPDLATAQNSLAKLQAVLKPVPPTK
jgi:tetratricopeptide (TPR) repeat protein